MNRCLSRTWFLFFLAAGRTFADDYCISDPERREHFSRMDASFNQIDTREYQVRINLNPAFSDLEGNAVLHYGVIGRSSVSEVRSRLSVPVELYVDAENWSLNIDVRDDSDRLLLEIVSYRKSAPYPQCGTKHSIVIEPKKFGSAGSGELGEFRFHR